MTVAQIDRNPAQRNRSKVAPVSKLIGLKQALPHSFSQMFSDVIAHRSIEAASISVWASAGPGGHAAVGFATVKR